MRDLRGRVLTKSELRGDRATSLEWIEKHASHPAVALALQHMQELIAASDSAGFLRSEFDRLRARGATPETMLASVMAVFMWAERNGQWEPGMKPFNEACFNVNLGRALLNTVPGRTRTSRNGKRYSIRISGSHAEGLGQNLRLSVGFLCYAAVLKILKDSGRQAPDARGRVILNAMRAAPFDPDEEE